MQAFWTLSGLLCAMELLCQFSFQLDYLESLTTILLKGFCSLTTTDSHLFLANILATEHLSISNLHLFWCFLWAIGIWGTDRFSLMKQQQFLKAKERSLTQVIAYSTFQKVLTTLCLCFYSFLILSGLILLLSLTPNCFKLLMWSKTFKTWLVSKKTQMKCKTNSLDHSISVLVDFHKSCGILRKFTLDKSSESKDSMICSSQNWTLKIKR